MNNACPECAAVYAVAEKDVGRRIACKKCGTALTVTEEGLVRDGAPSSRREPRRDDDERQRTADEPDFRDRRNRDYDDEVEAEDRPRKRDGNSPAFWQKTRALAGQIDMATWLYGFGLLLTIYSYYTPRIDEANVASRQGDFASFTTERRAELRDWSAKADGKISQNEIDAHAKAIKEKDKEEGYLQDRIDYAKAAAEKAKWWNAMYRLAGLIVLGFGAILYFIGDGNQNKRILGGVTILLILLHVVIGGVGLHIQAG